MANSKFNVDGPAFEGSTSEVIRPDHVMPLQVEADVDTPILHTPPGSPAPQEEQGRQAPDAPENSVLKCILEDASDPLHAFQEYEHYSLTVNYESDCEVPEFEDELTNEMEDTFSGDLNQLFPVNSQEEEGSTEGDHGQQSPGNLSQEDTMAIEENIKLSVVNVPATEPEDPSTLRHLDEMEDIIVVKEDQLVPVNSQDTQHFTENDHDQSIPVIIPVEDVCDKQNGLIPVNLQEQEDPTAQLQGVHGQTSPVIIPVEDTISPEGNETCPVNLHLTVVNGTEPGNPSNPILRDIHVDAKPPESEDSDELLHETAPSNGDSTD